MSLGSELIFSAGESQKNLEQYKKTIKNFHKALSELSINEKDASVIKHRKRNKLLARERVIGLLDPGTPLLELGSLAGYQVYEDVKAGAGIICAIGQVSGRLCMIVANDATVKGGTYFPLTVKKHLRAQEIALENSLPCIYLVDSGGAYLPLQDQVFPDRDHFGRIFYNQAKMSSHGIPQIAVVLGSCTAGGAYVPAMCDQTVMVRGQGTIFLGGPPLVKAATGVEVTAEELGGADVHCRISGVSDYLAENDTHALEITRKIVAALGETRYAPALHQPAQEPLYPTSDIAALIPANSKQQFPMRDVLARILDASELDEFKAEYGKTIICGFSCIMGHQVAIIANDGILFSESALKATHFIQMCDRRNIPILFVQNISGFMVGKEYEHRGIAKDGAKLVTAVSCARVPKITLIVGGSFGAGNYGMSGRAFQPRFLFSWPSSRIAVMGPTQAASVLTEVKRANEKPSAQTEKKLKAYYQSIEEQYLLQSDALYATARLWDDGIIEPENTRNVLGLALAVCRQTPRWSPQHDYGIFRM
jgi:3-methylcrotonyl-CoA carboxylase beta subunit